MRARIARYSASYLILRTNFIERGKWKFPEAFTDRFATYLYSDQVAKAIKNLFEKRYDGLVHVCGKTRMSLYESAKLLDPTVKPINLLGYTGPSVTVNMSLTSHRIPLFNIDS